MRKLLTFAIFVCILPTTLSAQFNPFFSPPPFGYVPPFVPTTANGGIPDLNEDSSNDGVKSATQPAAPVNLNFTLNAAQRKRNVANVVSAVAKVSPESAPIVAGQFADGAIFGQYGQLLDSVGLDPNNVADNFTAYWITAWEASTGRTVDTSPDTYAAVQEQVKRIFNNNTVGAMSNADKQKMSDDMIVRTLMLASQIERGKADPEYARQLAIGIKKSTKASGLDLDAMTLTPDGFKPRSKKRGDASGAAGDVMGGEEQALASNDTTATATPMPSDSEEWSTSKLAMIAAAGGAGIAGVYLVGKAAGKKG